MSSVDGGYYAVKGFIYQFDKTIELVISNQKNGVEIENHQDIEINDYCYQLKYKETKTYSPSKIKPAIIKILDDFQVNPTKKYILFCYFKDKKPEQIKLTHTDIVGILSKDINKYSNEIIDSLSKNFTLIFSEDYQTNFQNLIFKIKTIYSLESEDSAIIYHSVFRSKIIDAIIKKPKGQRIINKEIFDKAISKTKTIISLCDYRLALGNERYLSLIKKKYFKFSTVHIPNLERLLVIECDTNTNIILLTEIILLISKKFFRKESSPPPIICIRNFKDTIRLKTKLLKMGIKFNDGTQFNGDKFDLKYLMESTKPRSGIVVKFVEQNALTKLIKTGEIDYVYDLCLFEPCSYVIDNNNFTCIKVSLEKTEQIINLLN